jgi:hypothetical protein
MTILELLLMLEHFPRDTPILNCPVHGHRYLGTETGLAFVQGTTVFDQKDPSTVAAFLDVLIIWRGRGLPSSKGDSIKVADTTDVYLVDHTWKAGTKMKGLLFTTEGIRFVPEDY